MGLHRCDKELGAFLFQTTFGAREVTERAQLIIQEALENAVKYSQSGPKSELEVSISSSGNDIEITVGSKPTPEDLVSLRAELNWICASEPQTAYIEAFRRTAEDPDGVATKDDIPPSRRAQVAASDRARCWRRSAHA
ncbi:MAG: hypothetical protein QM784_39250 [Polyangiaceae bacterium]